MIGARQVLMRVINFVFQRNMNRIAALCCLLSSTFALEHQSAHQHQRRVGRIEEEEVAVVKAQEPSLLARLIGEETQARVFSEIFNHV